MSGLFAQKGLKVIQQRCLAGVFIGQAKCRHYTAQQVISLKLRGHQLRGDHLTRIQFAKQALDQGGLAGTDAAGDDDETLALAQAIAQIGQRPAVPAAAEEETRVRA